MPQTLTALLDTAPEALFVLDGKGLVVSSNRPAERLFGVEGRSAVGRHVVEVAVPERLRERTAAHLQAVLADDPLGVRGRHSAFIGRHGDGGEFPAEVRIDRIGEAPARFTAWIRDVSATAGERPLLADAERVAAVGHFAWDARTDLATWSPAVYDILGLDPAASSPSAQAFTEMVHPADRDLLGPLVGTGRPSGFEFRVLRADGQVRTVRATRNVHHDDAGRLLRVTGVMRDITGERQAEALWAAHRGMHDVLLAWEGFAEGIGALLARLGTAMGWIAGGLWVPQEDGTLVCRGFWSRPGDDLEDYERLSRSLRLRPGQGLVTQAHAERTLVAVDDVTVLPRFRRREAARKAGLRSAVALPAVHDGEVLAVLELYAPDPRGVDDTARTALGLIGEQLGAFLHRRRGDLRPGALTPREVEVLQLAAEGNGVGEIAEALVLSTGTVRTHFKNIYDRLGVRDRAAAVAEAMRLGLVS